jgi:hypothetical protein
LHISAAQYPLYVKEARWRSALPNTSYMWLRSFKSKVIKVWFSFSIALATFHILNAMGSGVAVRKYPEIYLI